MMSKEQKKNYVEEMKKVFSSNEAVMIAHYKGLNVKELDKISDELAGASKMHKSQSDRIKKILDQTEDPKDDKVEEPSKRADEGIESTKISDKHNETVSDTNSIEFS